MGNKIEKDSVGNRNIFEIHKQYDKDFFVKASGDKIKPSKRRTESFFHIKGNRHGK